MNRKAYVDFSKCIAIFFVLLNHIGLTIPWVSAFGGMFYVPVFFLLAGYTYKAKAETYSSFVGRKAKRLLMPYMVANLVYFVFFFVKDDVLGGTVGVQSLNPLWGILYSRYSLYSPFKISEESNRYFLTIQNSPTWFLTALFLTYLLFEVIVRIANYYGQKQSEYLSLAIACGACLLVGVILHYGCPVLLAWSLDCIPFFVIYMLAGYYVARENLLERIWEKKGLFPYLVLGFLIFSTIGGYRLGGFANISVGYFGNYTVLGLLNGIVSSLLLLFASYKFERWLPEIACKVGRNTLPILCYHLFVFMFLITGCNLLLPGRLDQSDALAYILKLAIVLATICVIMVAVKGIEFFKKIVQNR